MASLQTHVFVNDEWVTQTITAEELIGTTSRSPAELPAAPPAPKPPTCGVLTRTIIDSPVIRWVLPVQLRSSRFNDVALVGDRYVQISELGTDCQLKPIAKKVYVGSRIRNCRVIGAHDYLTRYRQDVEANYNKSGDDGMIGSNSPSPLSSHEGTGLFQQLLLLVLSSGDLEFLFMSLTPAGDWKFIASQSPILGWRLVDPGFHITVSPDSRYMAISCSETLFIMYYLKSIEELRKQHSDGVPIQPIQFRHARALRGVIHKLDFLHSDSQNPSHNVLLVITTRSGVFRLATYDWEDSENSESLIQALNQEKLGVRLDGTAGIPLLIIPLMVSCQFLIIREHYMETCSEVLGGSPVFTPFVPTPRDATDRHHGSHPPIWTAWTRPLREKSYHSNTDLIYLVREDGWVNFLEISDSGIEASIYMGPLECNIDSAFAAISIPHGDILVAGGDDGPGRIWSVEARRDPKPIGQLPNWSPTFDLVLTNDSSRPSKSENKKASKRTLLADKTATHMLAPERIFACSGRGVSGAIVELRHGIQAKIGLDLLYTSPIKKCWAIPSLNGVPEEGIFMLLALPENSAILHISQDLSEVSEKDQDAVGFDLLSTTLAVHASRDIIIQITTMHATIVSASGCCYQHSISDMVDDPMATVTDAAITDEILALSVYSHSAFKMMVFGFDKTKFLPKDIFEVEGEVTALSIAMLSVGVCILVGLSQKDLSELAIFPVEWSQSGGRTLTGSRRAPIKLKLGEDEDVDSMSINAVTSIICLGDDKIMVGMRNGGVVTIHPTDSCQPGQEFKVARTNRFGVSPSQVFTGPVLDTGPSSLVCNDAGLAIIKEPDEKSNQGHCFEEISQVWLTDASEPHSSSPTINSIAVLRELLDSGGSVWAMVAGAHIFITEIQPHPTPIPRYMSIGGTPKGILFSERLNALVTVVIRNGIPSLHFFDPSTGTDLSRPIKKGSGSDDVDVDYIPCLGTPGVKVVSLLNWRYKNNGNIYEWFVILTSSDDNSQGSVLVVSADQEAVVTNTGNERRIRFWGQFLRKVKAPRSGTTDDNGLFLNFGKVLEYHVIKDKKFKLANKYELPSPAASLEVIDGRLHALTTHHSLIILDYMDNTGLPRPKMLQLYTDEIARNGLHSIGVGLCSGNSERQQRLILVSDPMCGVYGLWPAAKSTALRLIFQAHLGVSIRKFVHGYTRPRWAKDKPRYGHLPSQPDRRSILGLSIDGSLVQFSILHEDVWRLFRYIQNRAAIKQGYEPPREYDDADSLHQLVPRSIAKTGMHINGDILQQVMENKILERLFSTPQELVRLRQLLGPFGLDGDIGDSPSPEQNLVTYEYTYSLIEYYLSSAL
ncbi:mono-functional DNA-alkylating methyl methanesulfonate N-term-domain-containing protein [Xylaria sp. FL1042]|nr:mono-functional DNA-alkylating methyl methanesulfonate N-term-domain-containing protein [Xylaria sp. FL1042]